MEVNKLDITFDLMFKLVNKANRKQLDDLWYWLSFICGFYMEDKRTKRHSALEIVRSAYNYGYDCDYTNDVIEAFKEHITVCGIYL